MRRGISKAQTTLVMSCLAAGLACSPDTSGLGDAGLAMASEAGDGVPSGDGDDDETGDSGSTGDPSGDGDGDGDGDPSGDGDGDGDPSGDGDGDPSGDGDGDPSGDGDGDPSGDGDGDPPLPDPIDVKLQAATATFSQELAGPFGIAEAIDGAIPADNSDNGWAIATEFGEQTAAFETVVDTPPAAGGTELTFTLSHGFFSEHNLGCFRLAVTTAERDSFADANQGFDDPGDVGAEALWSVVEVIAASSTDGAAMSVRADGAVLVEDVDSLATTYTVVATTPLSGITGVRLEALEDPSLPQDGPGTQNSNGNFVLVEFAVAVVPLP